MSGVGPGKVLVNFQVTPKQREYIRRMAKLCGLTMADYCRMQAMNPIERED